MIDYRPFYRIIETTPLEPWLEALSSRIEQVLNEDGNRNLPLWRSVLQNLPHLVPSSIDLQSAAVRIGAAKDCDDSTRTVLEGLLRRLHPWRKGPFSVFGIQIDTEWRSDWKWDRLSRHIEPLKGRLVLDVGCGNGYHCWRMAGAGAGLVIGIDPMVLYGVQFEALRRFAATETVHVLPLTLEAFPQNLQAFDTVFSMGVLYHRRSPLDHLLELRSCLRGGGELVLETLVIDGPPGQVLVPEGRYAKMRNVWFIPSCSTLESWMKRCGFRDIRLIDVCRTTTAEQRATDWMTFESLPDFLDPVNPNLTIEGHPAPQRAIFLASLPV